MPLQGLTDPDLIPAAFTLVQNLGCAFYDALYVALALRLGIPFLTADDKLYRRIAHLPEIVRLADFPSPSKI